MCLLSIGGSRCSVDDFAVTNLVRFTSIVRDDATFFFLCRPGGGQNVSYRIAAK